MKMSDPSYNTHSGESIASYRALLCFCRNSIYDDPSICGHGERVLNRLKDKCMCLKDEKERLYAVVAKSDTMEKEKFKCKEEMKIEVAKCRIKLAVEKEKYRSMTKQYHIPLAFLILFIALYVTRI